MDSLSKFFQSILRNAPHQATSRLHPGLRSYWNDLCSRKLRHRLSKKVSSRAKLRLRLGLRLWLRSPARITSNWAILWVSFTHDTTPRPNPSLPNSSQLFPNPHPKFLIARKIMNGAEIKGKKISFRNYKKWIARHCCQISFSLTSPFKTDNEYCRHRALQSSPFVILCVH